MPPELRHGRMTQRYASGGNLRGQGLPCPPAGDGGALLLHCRRARRDRRRRTCWGRAAWRAACLRRESLAAPSRRKTCCTAVAPCPRSAASGGTPPRAPACCAPLPACRRAGSHNNITLSATTHPLPPRRPCAPRAGDGGTSKLRGSCLAEWNKGTHMERGVAAGRFRRVRGDGGARGGWALTAALWLWPAVTRRPGAARTPPARPGWPTAPGLPAYAQAAPPRCRSSCIAAGLRGSCQAADWWLRGRAWAQ